LWRKRNEGGEVPQVRPALTGQPVFYWKSDKPGGLKLDP
jgi:hypothetical protein